KYMARQVTRLGDHIVEDGVKKSVTYFYKMTANYSKQFIGKTIESFAKGTVTYKVVGALLQ
ncbi:MAG: hypothetical protein II164_07270, partial [Firmicutes bacterium]|nr:hypothetical protein [Bacillota bacterium]